MNEQPQDAMEQDQAEQGLDREYEDFVLGAFLNEMWHEYEIDPYIFKLLCRRLQIDVRNVT